MPVRVRTHDRDRKYCCRTARRPTQWVKQLARHLGRQSDSSCPSPIGPESLAAKATASAYPAGSVSRGLVPRTRLAPYRPSWQTPVRLHSRRPDLWELTSKPPPLTAALLRHCRTRPLAAQHSPAILPLCLAKILSAHRIKSLRQYPDLGFWYNSVLCRACFSSG
jgi:hypothetical protein